MATSSEDEQDEEVNQLDDTFTPSTVIKDLRKKARRRFTDERRAIQSLVDTEGDLSALTVRRENLKRLFDDCVALQERFVRKTVQEDDDRGREKQSQWSRKLGNDFQETNTLAEGYVLAKRSEKQPSAPPATENLREQVEDTTGRFAAMTSPSHSSDKQPEEHTRRSEQEVPPRVLHSTAISDPAQEDAVAIAERIRAKRRKLESDLEESRIEEERKRDDLKRKAIREEKELEEKLAAAGGSRESLLPSFVSAAGTETHQDGGNTSRLTPSEALAFSIRGITPIGPDGTERATDSWIFEPFPTVPFDAATSAAMLFMVGATKANIEPFTGDSKEWPMFIQNFKATVHDVFPSDAQRISHLRGMLHKDLQRSFRQVLSGPFTYRQALQDLWGRYGQPHLVVQEYIKDLRDVQPVKEHDAKALDNFQQLVHGTIAALDAAGYGHELNLSIALKDLVDKLPNPMIKQWGRQVRKMSSASKGPFRLTINAFDKWLEDEVMANKYAPLPTPADSSSRRTNFSGRSSYYPRPSSAPPTVNAITAERRPGTLPETRNQGSCGICHQNIGHGPTMCNAFMEMSSQDKLNALRDLKSCFRCLGRHHLQGDCKKSTMFCAASGCGSTHHSLLHEALVKNRKRQ